MMTDQMDMLADPDSEAQAEDVYNQILGEIGMSITDSTKTGSGALAVEAKPAAIVEDDLQARLDALKK